MSDSVITNWAQTQRMRKFTVDYGSGCYTIEARKDELTNVIERERMKPS